MIVMLKMKTSIAMLLIQSMEVSQVMDLYSIQIQASHHTRNVSKCPKILPTSVLMLVFSQTSQLKELY
jgi:hypothetical protein